MITSFDISYLCEIHYRCENDIDQLIREGCDQEVVQRVLFDVIPHILVRFLLILLVFARLHQLFR